MTEYALATFGFLALSGILSLILYGEGRAERGAIGIIAAFIIISPLATFFTDMDFSFLDDIAKDSGYESGLSPSEIAERGLIEGIKSAVADKFMIDKEDIRVKTEGFDMEKMSCKSIRIYLSGSAALADYRGIEQYVNSLGMGECRVEIQLGQSN